jgi:hypothetical protein
MLCKVMRIAWMYSKCRVFITHIGCAVGHLINKLSIPYRYTQMNQICGKPVKICG